MTTSIDQARNALNDYEEWVEERTLDGLDLSVEAYIADLEATENERIVTAIRRILDDLDYDKPELRLARIALAFNPDQKEPSA